MLGDCRMMGRGSPRGSEAGTVAGDKDDDIEECDDAAEQLWVLSASAAG